MQLLTSNIAGFSEILFTLFTLIIKFQLDLSYTNIKQALHMGFAPIIVLKTFVIICKTEYLSNKIKDTKLILARLISNNPEYEERKEVSPKIFAKII